MVMTVAAAIFLILSFFFVRVGNFDVVSVFFAFEKGKTDKAQLDVLDGTRRRRIVVLMFITIGVSYWDENE